MGAGHLTATERDEVKNAIVARGSMLVAGILAGLDDNCEMANDKYEGSRNRGDLDFWQGSIAFERSNI